MWFTTAWQPMKFTFTPQQAGTARSEFDPELFFHSAYVKFFCDIRSKSAVFNILRQNVTILYIGNGKTGRK